MRLIFDSLAQIKALPSDLGAADVKQHLERLKGDLLARKNAYVANLITAA